MPKTSDLPIRRADGRAKPWLLDVLPRYSDSGKRERRFFAARREAEAERRRLLDLHAQHGASVRSLPPSVLDEAARAVKLLKPTGASLIEAARAFVAAWTLKRQSLTFRELWSREREGNAVKDLAETSRNQIYYVGHKILPLLGDRLLSEITARDMEDVLTKMAPTDSTRAATIRVISKVFKRAVALGYAASNPLDGVERPKRREMNPEVLTPTQAKRLLDACGETDAELLPFFALALFAGIRPDEIKRLRWEDIELEENHIRIRSEHSKTRTKRFVEIEPNLAEWLLPFRKPSGPVVREANFRARFDCVRKAAGLFDAWQSDICRHSYCSYWLAAHEDLNRLRANVGHRSPDLLFRHYHKAVKAADARRFWQIKPGAELAKIRTIA